MGEQGRLWRTRWGIVPPMPAAVCSVVFALAMVVGICGGVAGALFAYSLEITGGIFDWGFVVFGFALAYVSAEALIKFVKAERT